MLLINAVYDMRTSSSTRNIAFKAIAIMPQLLLQRKHIKSKAIAIMPRLLLQRKHIKSKAKEYKQNLS